MQNQVNVRYGGDIRMRKGEAMSSGFWSVRKMKNGDEQELENFVREYYPTILRYCYRHVFDADAAEDMTQETFERFFSSLDRYRHYGKALNYLYVIAGNLCRNALRSRREITFSQLGADSVQGILPEMGKDFGAGIRGREAGKEYDENAIARKKAKGYEAGMCSREGAAEAGHHVVRMDLEQAVLKLPEELREVVILYYFQELKLREIAEILEIGLPLVKYRMRKAKECLKSVLGEDYL